MNRPTEPGQGHFCTWYRITSAIDSPTILPEPLAEGRQVDLALPADQRVPVGLGVPVQKINGRLLLVGHENQQRPISGRVGHLL